MKLSELLDSLGQDLGYAARQLRKSPGFAGVAVATLALGVGLTTSMFTVVNGVFFRPLPFHEPDRLLVVGVQTPAEAVGTPRVRDMHYADIERSASAFSAVATYMAYPPTTLTGAGEAARMTAAWVTPAFLDVLGVRPALGSGFAPTGNGGRSSAEVILGDALWRSRFGADPAVLGRTATLDGIARTIVGVMPPGFDFPDRATLWLPLEAHPARAAGLSFSNPVLARLGENTTPEQARADLESLAVSAEWRIGRSPDVPLIRMLPLKTAIVGDSRYPLLIFTGAVALVLLISCTNVANLLLMRAATREQEIGLRKVLGAGRSRLVRQLLTESLGLAVLGGTLGIVVGAAGTRALLALAPPGAIPRGQELGMDLTVLGFALAVSLLTGIVFGLAPAFRATGRELWTAIAGASRTHSRRGGLARNGLVVAELGLAVILLTGAGLLIRSFQEIRGIDRGFDPSNTLSFFVDLPADEYDDREAALALHERVVGDLARIPGVQYAGAANFEPFGPIAMSTRVRTEDDPDTPSGVVWMVASPGYFRAMGIPMVYGRGFTPQDDGSATEAVVVSRFMARQLWPDRNPVGERLSLGRDEWVTVVGVAEDVVQDVTAEVGAVMYLPLAQISEARELSHMSYVVRTAADPSVVAPSMRAIVREADPNLPQGTVVSMDQVVLSSLADRVFQTRVLGIFAALAVLLAAVGVYGVTAYSVNERTREIGIRLALGARSGQVARLTLVKVFSLIAVGLVLGAAGGRAAAALLDSWLYEVSPADPLTYAAVALLLIGVAVIAALAPIRRATRVSPLEILND